MSRPMPLLAPVMMTRSMRAGMVRSPSDDVVMDPSYARRDRKKIVCFDRLDNLMLWIRRMTFDQLVGLPRRGRAGHVRGRLGSAAQVAAGGQQARAEPGGRARPHALRPQRLSRDAHRRRQAVSSSAPRSAREHRRPAQASACSLRGQAEPVVRLVRRGRHAAAAACSRVLREVQALFPGGALRAAHRAPDRRPRGAARTRAPTS